MGDKLIKFGKVKYHVLDVAAYCLENYSFNCFKLQKTLYYIQAAFIVEKNRPCFMGRIISAGYGPIIPTIENVYSVFGNQIIHLSGKNTIGNSKVLQDTDKELIDKICAKCQDMSGSDLSIKTHKEDPWLKAEPSGIISCNSILDYYSNNRAHLIM